MFRLFKATTSNPIRPPRNCCQPVHEVLGVLDLTQLQKVSNSYTTNPQKAPLLASNEAAVQENTASFVVKKNLAWKHPALYLQPGPTSTNTPRNSCLLSIGHLYLLAWKIRKRSSSAFSRLCFWLKLQGTAGCVRGQLCSAPYNQQ